MSEYARPLQTFSDWPTAAKVVLGLFVLILLVIVWSVLASTIFLAGTGLLKPDVVPFIQWWLYFMAYGFHHAVVGSWLTISAVSATAVPVVLAGARMARGGGLGGANRPLHGKTRWAKRKEMERAGFYVRFRGLYVGKDKDGRYLRFGGEEHVACYAPTRSGKGVGLVIPNCMLYDASLVCLDVKKENWAATAGIRKAAGQKVFLFDPLAPDGRTARYNPFGYVRRGTVDAFDDVQRIAQMVFPHVSGDQQFWTDAGRSAFVGAACFLAETPELPLTFGEVLRLLSSSDAADTMLERIAARRAAGKPYSEATVKLLEDYLRGSPDLVNSIRKTVTARLSLWANPRIDAATTANDFDLRNLRQSLHAIYIGVTPDNIARLRPLLALLFQQIVDLSVRTMPKHDPTAKYQLLMLLDEFPLLGPMPVLADAFSYVAGYGIRMLLIMQSKAQLRDRALYGPDKAAAILDNCGLEVVFGTKDLQLTQELSARLGYDTVQGSSRTGQRFYRMFQRQSETNSDQRRALLLPHEIARLDASEAILIRPGLFPIRCRRIQYFNDATFAKLALRPPDIEPITIDIRLDRGNVSPEKRVVRPQAAAPGTPPTAGIKADVEDSETWEERSEPTSPSVPRRRTTSKAKSAKSAKGKVKGKATASDAGSEEGANVVELRPGTSHPAHVPSPSQEVETENLFPLLTAEQADGLMVAIEGVVPSFQGLGMQDSKALIANMISRIPTVETLSGRESEHESSGERSSTPIAVLGTVTADRSEILARATWLNEELVYVETRINERNTEDASK